MSQDIAKQTEVEYGLVKLLIEGLAQLWPGMCIAAIFPASCLLSGLSSGRFRGIWNVYLPWKSMTATWTL